MLDAQGSPRALQMAEFIPEDVCQKARASLRSGRIVGYHGQPLEDELCGGGISSDGRQEPPSQVVAKPGHVPVADCFRQGLGEMKNDGIDGHHLSSGCRLLHASSSSV